MWLARQVDSDIWLQLHWVWPRIPGRSTYASATMHLLIFVYILVSGFFQ